MVKEERLKVYISGPISKDDWYEAHFAKAERYLKDMGYETVNPVSDGLAGKGVTYKEYIDSDLQLLAECDGIFMLRGWQRSNGARLEHAYAKTTGMWIRYQG